MAEGIQLIDTTGTCADCGKPAQGFRCKKCWGKEVVRQALVESSDADRAILQAIDVEKLRRRTLALQMGISQVQLGNRIRRAREREALRSANPLYNIPSGG